MSDVQSLEDLIRRGHFAQARTRAEEMLKESNELRVKQLYAFALSKSGVPEAARDYLESVARDLPDDPETNGILGGIFKELFKKNESTTFAIQARDTYDRNFKQTRNYYTGINSATMSTLAGQGKRGKEIAQEVLALLKDPDNDFWEAATQAEALLLLKERAKSVEAYAKARKLAGSDWGKISSVYNQLWLLKHYFPVPQEALRTFSPPVVAAFTGHMVDRPDSNISRFPAQIEGRVKASITSAISTLNAKIGYCSLACGGDILFAEAMEEADGELNLFLPFRKDDFVEASVRFAGDGWVQRFNRLVEKYPVTYLTPEPYDNHPDLFALLTHIIFGLALLRSRSTHQEPSLITLLSEKDMRRKTGGVRDTLALWPNPNTRITINPDLFLPDVPATPIPESATDNNVLTDRPVLYFVCCDLVSDPKLNTALIDSLTDLSLPPAIHEVKDDKLIAGFRTIISAMEFCDVAAKSLMHQFESKSSVKIGIHAGPFRLKDGSNASAIAGALIDKVIAVNKLALPGTTNASSIVAAILALNKAKYAIEYVDTIAGDENEKGFDVYKVRKV